MKTSRLLLGTLAGLLCFGGMTDVEGSVTASVNEIVAKNNLENVFDDFDRIIKEGKDSLESHKKFLNNVFNIVSSLSKKDTDGQEYKTVADIKNLIPNSCAKQIMLSFVQTGFNCNGENRDTVSSTIKASIELWSANGNMSLGFIPFSSLGEDGGNALLLCKNWVESEEKNRKFEKALQEVKNWQKNEIKTHGTYGAPTSSSLFKNIAEMKMWQGHDNETFKYNLPVLLELSGAEQTTLRNRGVYNDVRNLYIAAIKSAKFVSKNEWSDISTCDNYVTTLRGLLESAGWKERDKEHEWNHSPVDPDSEIGKCIKLLKAHDPKYNQERWFPSFLHKNLTPFEEDPRLTPPPFDPFAKPPFSSNVDQENSNNQFANPEQFLPSQGNSAMSYNNPFSNVQPDTMSDSETENLEDSDFSSSSSSSSSASSSF